MFVVVPARSWTVATGSTASANTAEGERKLSSATTKSALSSASAASSASGKSPMGSAPSSTSTFISPEAEASKIPAASRPGSAGRDPQALVNHSLPSSIDTRPGSTPGASPMSRAPMTLPRRRAGRNRAEGHAWAIVTAAMATSSPRSAREGRPTTIATPSSAAPASAPNAWSQAGPPAECGGAVPLTSAPVTEAASPGR